MLDFGSRVKALPIRLASTGLSALVALGVILFVSGTARERVAAAELLPGPVPGRVIAVIDADTLAVAARIWLGQDVEVRVRLAGVDAPELRGACPHERVLAREARALVVALIDEGDVTLTAVSYGKYAGRVVARVIAHDGTDVAEALIAAGLARAYAGGARLGWCDRAGGPD